MATAAAGHDVVEIRENPPHALLCLGEDVVAGCALRRGVGAVVGEGDVGDVAREARGEIGVGGLEGGGGAGTGFRGGSEGC